jgi:hypothetical protein
LASSPAPTLKDCEGLISKVLLGVAAWLVALLLGWLVGCFVASLVGWLLRWLLCCLGLSHFQVSCGQAGIFVFAVSSRGC